MASRDIWLDTSFVYALLDQDDANHARAVATLDTLGQQAPFVTSEHVLAECYTLARMRLGWNAAHDCVDLAERLCKRVFYGRRQVWVDANRFAQWADQDFSMVDCLSFAFMSRLKIKEFASFDGHFRSAGYRPCAGIR